MIDPTDVLQTASDLIKEKDGPWHTRTEFWGTLATTALGLIGARAAASPVTQAISTGLGLVAPIVYNIGRSNVKAATAAGIMATVAQALQPPAAPQ